MKLPALKGRGSALRQCFAAGSRPVKNRYTNHIIARGIVRKNIFEDDKDRDDWSSENTSLIQKNGHVFLDQYSQQLNIVFVLAHLF